MTITLKEKKNGSKYTELRQVADGYREYFEVLVSEERGGILCASKRMTYGEEKKAKAAFNRYAK